MPDDDTPRKPASIWLTPHELAAVDRLAAAEQRTRSQMAAILISEAITARQKGNPR